MRNPNQMNYVDVIGYIATTLIMVGFLPQAWQVWRTKSVEDVSLPTYAILMAGAIVWFVYGYLKSDGPIMLTNAVLFMVQGSIVVCKLKYRKK